MDRFDHDDISYQAVSYHRLRRAVFKLDLVMTSVDFVRAGRGHMRSSR
ncbi:MAG: hypothetical protein ACLRSW_07970 [Christensenellaceae bacterium]